MLLDIEAAALRLISGAGREGLAASARMAAQPLISAGKELLGLSQNAESPPKPAVAAASVASRPSLRLPARNRRPMPAGVCLAVLIAAAMASLPGFGPGPAPATQRPAANLVVSAATAAPTDAPDLVTGDGAILNYGRLQPVTYDSRSLLLSYTVQSRDTLGRIAGKFGLAVTTIYWANKSKLPDPQALRPGQVLTIPPMDGLVVTVAIGDTLDSLAAKYSVSSQDIIDGNNLPAPVIVAGQVLIVPGAETGPLPFSDGGGGAVWSGRLDWPVPGHHGITQRFGCTGVLAEQPFGNCRHYHNAIDIGAPSGSGVVAAASGTVIYAGWKGSGSDGFGGGIAVWISHGGKLYTTYNHLSAEFVRVGQRVTAGQRIGSIGMTGNASGPHLHFEVWACYPWTGGTVSCARNPLRWTR